MSELVTHRRTITAPVSEYEVDGQQFLVVPTVAAVEGVLNGELVLADEIGKYPSTWEDVPVPVGHPQVNGLHVSARIFDQVRHAPGRLYDVAMDGPALKGSIWLNVARAEALGGDAAQALTMLRAGQPVEVSTAYWRDLEIVAGEWDGQAYTGIARNIRPDHLALLPGQVGACSWADGCGAPRVNEQQPAPEPDQHDGGNEMIDETLHTDCSDCPEQPAANEAPVETAVPALESEPVIGVSPEIEALAQVVAEFGGIDAFKQALLQFKANADAERAGLIDQLAANKANAFSRADMEAMPTEALRKLDASLRPADYSGRGLPVRANADEWTPYVAPEVK